VSDYKFKNKAQKATIKTQIERLPNVLCIQLKRFIWMSDYGAAIKKVEFVEFEEILEIEDEFVSPKLRLGVFN